MSVQIHLTARQQQVLRATVHHYIATAEPVGSKVIAEEYNLKASPATIRTAMGALEKAGLLFQPHTSAGRIPSDSGYRIYVDQLISPSPDLCHQVNQALAGQFSPLPGQGLEALMRRAAQILSSLSGYVTLVTLPQIQGVCLRHVQLMQVAPYRIMLLVVTDNYTTESWLIDLPKSMQEDQDNNQADSTLEQALHILSNFLNERLKNKSFTEFSRLDWSELGREFQQYAELLQSHLQTIVHRNQPNAFTHILVSGVSEMLRQPEFSVTQQAQVILQLLEEEQDQLLPLIFDGTESSQKRNAQKRVNVWIGAENPLEPMRACALVSATYCRDRIPVGSVGMLGPTRMMYENAIAWVEAAADYLSDVIA